MLPVEVKKMLDALISLCWTDLLPVNHFDVVYVLQSQQDLQRPTLHYVLREEFALLRLPFDVVLQVTLLAILLNAMDAFVVLHHFIQLDDVWVAHALHQRDLTRTGITSLLTSSLSFVFMSVILMDLQMK